MTRHKLLLRRYSRATHGVCACTQLLHTIAQTNTGRIDQAAGPRTACARVGVLSMSMQPPWHTVRGVFAHTAACCAHRCTGVGRHVFPCCGSTGGASHAAKNTGSLCWDEAAPCCCCCSQSQGLGPAVPVPVQYQRPRSRLIPQQRDDDSKADDHVREDEHEPGDRRPSSRSSTSGHWVHHQATGSAAAAAGRGRGRRAKPPTQRAPGRIVNHH